MEALLWHIFIQGLLQPSIALIVSLVLCPIASLVVFIGEYFHFCVTFVNIILNGLLVYVLRIKNTLCMLKSCFNVKFTCQTINVFFPLFFFFILKKEKSKMHSASKI